MIPLVCLSHACSVELDFDLENLYVDDKAMEKEDRSSYQCLVLRTSLETRVPLVSKIAVPFHSF